MGLKIILVQLSWILISSLVPKTISAYLWRYHSIPSRTRPEKDHVQAFLLKMATSSSDLKKSDRKNKKRDIKSVAARLSKAAKEAAAVKPKSVDDTIQEYPRFAARFSRQTTPLEQPLKSITDLSRTIDEELLRPRDGYRPPRETTSMRTLLEHNDEASDAMSNGKITKRRPTCSNVAMVFSKPLCKDQITTEYVSRLTLLAHIMKDENYRPSLICFCGSTKPKQDNLVAETSAGVIFFRHLCAANDISLDDVDICIIKHEDAKDTSWSSCTSLHPVAEELFHRGYLQSWLEKSHVCEAATDEYGMTRDEPRKKIHIHFTMISTDYHLCNLNDIHTRSPRQSPLKAMLQELEQSIRSFRGLAEITWQFRYSPYPYVDSKDELTVFLGKCYKLAQELRPLLVNIRGVANQVRGFCIGMWFFIHHLPSYIFGRYLSLFSG